MQGARNLLIRGLQTNGLKDFSAFSLEACPELVEG